jgi:tetraether lipid synthase
MHKPIKYVEKGLTVAAKGAWTVFNGLNSIKPAKPFTPNWSDKPILKSWQKVKPPLGWPRETDSLCPNCVREARQEILDGKRDYKVLLNEKIGEIKANIIERDGKILMVKDCPRHGHFEDVMAMDPAFFKHLEDAFPGSDIRSHNDEKLHNHGTSTIKYGRGAVLTVDLTNRCNMMYVYLPHFTLVARIGLQSAFSWRARTRPALRTSMSKAALVQTHALGDREEPAVVPQGVKAWIDDERQELEAAVIARPAEPPESQVEGAQAEVNRREIERRDVPRL